MLLAAGVLFLVRLELYTRAFDAQTLTHFMGQKVLVEGRVLDDPDRRLTSTHVVVEVERVDGRRESGRLLVFAPREAAVAYNERVEARGVLRAPEAFETDAGRTFDYPNYLRVRGIQATMSYAEVEVVQKSGPTLLGALFALKHRFEESLERSLPEPQVSLVEGMLLGERGGFPQELLQMFVVVGLIHIVVLSGSNISIVAEGVFRSLGFLPRTFQYSVGFVMIVLFALMAGGGAATARAVIMGGIAVVARYLHRPTLALRSLCVAAAAMLMWNPFSLQDTGFVLSVLATFGMITLAPWFEQKISFVPAWKKFDLRSIVATTLGVELFILPALLFYSGILSFVSVPINALVLPLVPVVMFFGFITALAGLVHPLVATLPAFAADFLLRFVLWLTEVSAALPLGSLTIPPFSGWVVVVLYIPLTYIAFRTYTESAKRTP